MIQALLHSIDTIHRHCRIGSLDRSLPVPLVPGPAHWRARRISSGIIGPSEASYRHLPVNACHKHYIRPSWAGHGNERLRVCCITAFVADRCI